MPTAPDPTGPREARPIFFIHVMKTGGMTLFAALRSQYAPGEVYPDPELDLRHDPSKPLAFRPFTLRYLEIMPEERRRKIRVFTGHFPFLACEVLGGDLAVATILRDPVERTLSLLKQLQRPASWLDTDETFSTEGMSLEEVYEQPQVLQPLVLNHQTKLFSLTAADAPRGYMHVIEVDDARLELAKANLERLDVVGVTERYDQFLDAVEHRFGWRVRRDARVNASPAGSTDHVSKSLRRRIAADNAIDVELHRHAVDLVAQHQRRPRTIL